MRGEVTGMTGGRGQRAWFDPRFAIGLIMVVASVTGVGLLVAGVDSATTVYSARNPLAIGERIHAADLDSSRVRFDSDDSLYLTPDRMPADGLVVTRAIGQGELVPVSSVGTRAGESVSNVVVEVRGTLAGAIAPGAVVDIWAAPAEAQSEFGPPSVLVPNASVVRLVESTSLIAGGTGRSVELLVPSGTVAAVLAAIANADAIALVPAHTALEE